MAARWSAIAFTLAGATQAAASSPVLVLDLPSQPLATTVAALQDKSRLEIWFSINTVADGLIAPAIKGSLTVEQALDRALAATYLAYRPELPVGYRICNIRECDPPVPELLIKGARSQNTDLSRSNDESGNYTVFGHEDFERSSAVTAGQFIRDKVPANVGNTMTTGIASISGGGSGISLRGIKDQTLVLVNGRRLPRASPSGDEQQFDPETIPLMAVERIEIRTGSASAIYGGYAVAGVINIITRHPDPEGNISVRAEQLAGIRAGTQEVRAEKSFELGKNEIAISGAWSRRDAVSMADHDTLSGGRGRIARSNPESLIRSPIPPVADGWNAHSIDGSALLKDGDSALLHFPSNFRLGDDAALLKNTQGEYASGLSQSAQTQGGGAATLRPALEVRSATATAQWAIADAFSADASASYIQSIREGQVSAFDEGIGHVVVLLANPSLSPFRTDALIAVPTAIGDGPMQRRESLFQIFGGITYRTSGDTVLRFEDSWSSADAQLRRPTIIGDPQTLVSHLLEHLNESPTLAELGGTLDVLSTPRFTDSRHETTLRLSGRWRSMPLTLNFARVDEAMLNGVTASGQSGEEQMLAAPKRSRRQYSVGGEIVMPFLGEPDRPYDAPVVVRLDARADTYRISVPAEDVTEEAPANRFRARSGALSVEYRAAKFLRLRASCATGFAPPPLSSLTGSIPARVSYPQLKDPERDGEPLGEVTVVTGGNPHLAPERSLSCGGGFEAKFGTARPFRIAADYSRIRRSDVVLTPGELFFADPVGYLNDFSSRIVREPLASGDSHSVGKIALVDSSSTNIAEQLIESVDVSAGWKTPDVAGGTLDLSLLTTFTPTFIRKTAPSSPSVNETGWTSAAPTRFRTAVSAAYESGPWTAGWSFSYTPEYRVSHSDDVIRSQGARYVDAQSYHDFFLSYSSTNQQGNWEVRADIRNVFRQKAPFEATSPNLVSPYGWDELPAYSISVRKRF